mgnify:CR=1|tara:strand:+ start:289 stop:504 length:216 start_codon:yes stop_codon:yes gene_type:complete
MTNQTIDDEEINNEENNALTLQSTHLQLESELSSLENQRFLTADEEQKIKELKKKKLAIKTQIEKMSEENN